MSAWVSPDTIVAAVAGLFGGAAGGLLTVVPITRLGERTKERRAAERAIASVVSEYRARLMRDRARFYRDSAYPKSYGDIKGQEQFAREVLTQAEDLAPRTSARIRAQVKLLVGRFALAEAEKQLHLPANVFDEAEEDQRQALELHRVIREDPADFRGLIGMLLRTQNEPTAEADYNAALSALNKLLEIVS